MQPTAAQQRTQRFAEFGQRCEQEEQEQCDRLIAEFDGDRRRCQTAQKRTF
jgi:hypothetical protein